MTQTLNRQIALSFLDDFDFLMSDAKMSVSEVTLDLISWANYFISPEFDLTSNIDQEVVLSTLLSKVNLSNFFSWMSGLNKINNVQHHLRLFCLEIQTILAAELEIQTVDTEDHLDYTIQEKLFWETFSINDAMELLKKNQTLFSSEMLFTKQIFQSVKDWLNEFAKTTGLISTVQETPKAQIDSSQSSGTQKKRKMDTSTSIIPVSTPKATVDAYFSKVCYVNTQT